MGGSGSTRWRNHRKAPLVTDAMAIDLRHPQWKAVLASGRAEGTLQWSDPRTGSSKGWADFILAPGNDGTRNLVLDRTGDPYAAKQLVVLGLRPAGFSSHWLAGCRGCDRWARTLYAISQSDLFKCRVCSGLTYQSAQAHDSRSDLARRDPVGFLASRAGAPQTLNSQWVTVSLVFEAQDPYRPGRGWGRKSITSVSRAAAGMRQDFIDRWGFPPEDSGKVARGG